jgi:ferrous iron transport protein B
MKQHSQAHGAGAKRTIVLVGNPNVGKSVIFSYMTGRYATVSNYPGTTVEVSRGRPHFDPDSLVIDTPGANSLHPQSMDEKVARDILLTTPVDLVLQVIDAKNLRRGLTITTQLAEMGLPVVLSLNMMDEAARRGIRISSDALSESIGIPIVETVAVEKKGFRKLIAQVSGSSAVPAIRVAYPAAIEDGIREISSFMPDLRLSKRALALIFLTDPAEAGESLESLVGHANVVRAQAVANSVQERFSHPLSYIIGVSRSRTVDRLLDTVFVKDVRVLGAEARKKIRRKQAAIALVFTILSMALYSVFGLESLGHWGLHPILLHIVVLLLAFALLPYRFMELITTHYILGTLFLVEILYLMYKFVGVFGAGTLVDLIENGLFQNHVIPAVRSGVDRLIPVAFVSDLLTGDYGLISMGLTYSIAIVMPIVATFFLAFGVLEDSGYLPRLSVVSDRAMRRIGLNGKAVLPMVLGLGCATMATLTTRILDSKKERIIATLLLALGIPCSAQLGVILAIVSQCSPFVMITVIGVVFMQLFIVGALSAKLVKGKSGDFIMELPPLRPPLLFNIVTKTAHRLKWFLMEAVPFFLAGTLVLFLIDRLGIIVFFEKAARPVIGTLLGLPVESTMAFIIGFFRRDYGAAGLFDLFKNGMLDHNQVAVSMIVITLFVPCIANFFVMIKERGWKTALLMVAFIFPYAIIVGALVNLILSITGLTL